jgi:hypothetical protein
MAGSPGLRNAKAKTAMTKPEINLPTKFTDG